MCGIAGFFHPEKEYLQQPKKWEAILHSMNRAQLHRGPDGQQILLQKHCGLAHVRLAILDLPGGRQPMTRERAGRSCTIVYNGEIYNMHDLKKELQNAGETFETKSDTEVLLAGFMRQGPAFVTQLNGMFAFAIWDTAEQTLWLFRDRLGIKPLFFTRHHNTLIFASEIKGLLCYPGVQAIADKGTLQQIFALGPARKQGSGVLKHIYEVKPGHYVKCHKDTREETCYWRLRNLPHMDSYEQTVEKTAALLTDSIRLRMLSDVPICTFLSGGLDSSLITAICMKHVKSQGKQLDTFSFDFCSNRKYFQANPLQPTQDAPYVSYISSCLHTQHHFLECGCQSLYRLLFASVRAHDLPCMADIDSSMLYFCRQVARTHKTALSGECADEIFGGYPWFYNPRFQHTDTFPWNIHFSPRLMLLRKDLLEELQLEEYAKTACQKTRRETPFSAEETPKQHQQRELFYLNLRWFMQTLLNRCDRTGMYTGLEVRVPFADHRLIEYLWNVPPEMKSQTGIVKELLRAAAKGLVPEKIRMRKKSPYPKTYHPGYEHLLKSRMQDILSTPNAPIHQLIDRKKVHHLLKRPLSYTKPFYGQLMAGPQLLAYLLQINYWLEHYQIKVLLSSAHS